ncbi:hypothetical protein [Streptomyces sp. NPDC096033]|uniref:hypothetical protein n=1 Tax=Streptomyces sp. NPDC096033 TaxID=3366071 RepID=UPI0038200D80
MTRWRLSDTKVDVQKETRHREAEETEHSVNTDYFNTPPLHEIYGHRPGVAFSDPQINPEVQKIHTSSLHESAQFHDGRITGYRPAGSSSPSSRNS